MTRLSTPPSTFTTIPTASRGVGEIPERRLGHEGPSPHCQGREAWCGGPGSKPSLASNAGPGWWSKAAPNTLPTHPHFPCRVQSVHNANLPPQEREWQEAQLQNVDSWPEPGLGQVPLDQTMTPGDEFVPASPVCRIGARVLSGHGYSGCCTPTFGLWGGGLVPSSLHTR